MNKTELEGALERAVSRAEFWELQAFVLRVRVRELEAAVRDHRKGRMDDSELWGVL